MEEVKRGEQKTYVCAKIVKASECTLYSFQKSNGTFEGNKGKNKFGYSVIHDDGFRGWIEKEIFERMFRHLTEEEKIIIEV